MSNSGDQMRKLMESVYPDLNYKVTEDEATDQEIAAISQLIADRTEDADAESKLSTEAFIGLINKMGIPMTKDTLMDLAERGTLGSVVKDVNADVVQFKGQKDIDPTEMTVDKAKDVVRKMAKRSAKDAVKDEE